MQRLVLRTIPGVSHPRRLHHTLLVNLPRHRRASPQPSHEGYGTLPRDQRVAVAKMAAMLRVAIALDETRSQRIEEFACQLDDGRLVITIPNIRDLSLEQMAIRQADSLFEEVYGLKVLLRHVN